MDGLFVVASIIYEFKNQLGCEGRGKYGCLYDIGKTQQKSGTVNLR